MSTQDKLKVKVSVSSTWRGHNRNWMLLKVDFKYLVAMAKIMQDQKVQGLQAKVSNALCGTLVGGHIMVWVYFFVLALTP